MPKDVSAPEFVISVVERSVTVPVVVDFWAAWCGPCRVLGPTLERLELEGAGAWELVKIDVDQNQALSGQFGVQGIPTVIGFRDGQPVARFTGALPEQQVRSWLGELVPSEADELERRARSAPTIAESERLYREALAHDSSHGGSRVGLAEILLDRGETEAADELLASLPRTPQVEQILARIALSPGDVSIADLTTELDREPSDHTRLALGRALAADGRYREALEHLQTAVTGDDGETLEAARTAMLAIFQILGDDPLVSEHRRRLANALF